MSDVVMSDVLYSSFQEINTFSTGDINKTRIKRIIKWNYNH